MILRKLILKEWVRAFMLAVLFLTFLILMANIVAELLRGEANLTDILKYNLLEYTTWLDKILPVSCLAATLFSLNKLRNRNELISILASGFSRGQVVKTLAMAGTCVAMIQLFSTAYLDPLSKRVKKKWVDNLEDFRDTQDKNFKALNLSSGKTWYKSRDYYFSFSVFDRKNELLKNISIYFFNPDNKVEAILHAEEAKYLGKDNWKFRKGTFLQNLVQKGFPTNLHFKEIDYKLNEKLSDFNSLEVDIMSLNIVDLHRYLQKMNSIGIDQIDYKIFFFSKFSSALTCIVFSLLSIAALFSPGRRHSSIGKDLFFIFIFTLSYWFINSSAVALGTSGKIPAFMSVFAIPVVAGVCILYILYVKRNLKQIRNT